MRALGRRTSFQDIILVLRKPFSGTAWDRMADMSTHGDTV